MFVSDFIIFLSICSKSLPHLDYRAIEINLRDHIKLGADAAREQFYKLNHILCLPFGYMRRPCVGREI